MMKMPAKGLSEDEVFDKLTHFADGDMPWREGKTLAYIYDGGADVERVAKRAYTQYLTENALDPTVYPSLARMERELIGITASMLGGDENVVGNFTSGGTESILLAVKTARDWARAVKKIEQPEIVLPVTAHAAFHKGADYFGLKKVLVPVDPVTFRAVPAEIEKAITPNTALIVTSAISYAHGVVDPVRDIAPIALKHNVLFHVDNAIGGFILQYFRRLGQPIPEFDFCRAGRDIDFDGLAQIWLLPQGRGRHPLSQQGFAPLSDLHLCGLDGLHDHQSHHAVGEIRRAGGGRLGGDQFRRR